MPVAFLERASYNDAIDVEGKWKAPRGALEEIGHPPPGGACIQHPSSPLPGPRTVSNEHEKTWVVVVDTVMTPQTVVTKKQERERVVSPNVARSHCIALFLFFSLQ